MAFIGMLQLTNVMLLNVMLAEGLFILNAVRLFPFIVCPLPFIVRLLSIKMFLPQNTL